MKLFDEKQKNSSSVLDAQGESENSPPEQQEQQQQQNQQSTQQQVDEDQQQQHHQQQQHQLESIGGSSSELTPLASSSSFQLDRSAESSAVYYGNAPHIESDTARQASSDKHDSKDSKNSSLLCNSSDVEFSLMSSPSPTSMCSPLMSLMSIEDKANQCSNNNSCSSGNGNNVDEYATGIDKQIYSHALLYKAAAAAVAEASHHSTGSSKQQQHKIAKRADGLDSGFTTHGQLTAADDDPNKLFFFSSDEVDSVSSSTSASTSVTPPKESYIDQIQNKFQFKSTIESQSRHVQSQSHSGLQKRRQSPAMSINHASSYSSLRRSGDDTDLVGVAGASAAAIAASYNNSSTQTLKEQHALSSSSSSLLMSTTAPTSTSSMLHPNHHHHSGSSSSSSSHSGQSGHIAYNKQHSHFINQSDDKISTRSLSDIFGRLFRPSAYFYS
jgi:hypothetical protein